MGVLSFRIAVFKVRFGDPQVVLEKDLGKTGDSLFFPSNPSTYRMMTERGASVVVKQIVSHDGP